jgi:beta-phosphoglucomutase-like phosphatase (HAD superfamily)
MGYKYKDCLVVEDTPVGATAAKRAGMDVLGLLRPTHTDEKKERQMKELQITGIITNLLQVKDYL